MKFSTAFLMWRRYIIFTFPPTPTRTRTRTQVSQFLWLMLLHTFPSFPCCAPFPGFAVRSCRWSTVSWCSQWPAAPPGLCACAWIRFWWRTGVGTTSSWSCETFAATARPATSPLWGSTSESIRWNLSVWRCYIRHENLEFIKKNDWNLIFVPDSLK